jgi:hypothetical protein
MPANNPFHPYGQSVLFTTLISHVKFIFFVKFTRHTTIKKYEIIPPEKFTIAEAHAHPEHIDTGNSLVSLHNVRGNETGESPGSAEI